MVGAAASQVINTVVGALTTLANIQANFVGWLAFIINYIIATIAGIFIAIETWLIGVILQLNGNVVNALAVQSGFQVTLALANLGFVLGIIVIAIATILRRETYGIKKLLWKLVLAAILVNFSLIIAGAIISFSDQITLTFMSNLPGQGGGVSVSWSGVSFPFADAIAGAFAPHRSLLVGFVQPNGQTINGTSTGGVIFSGSGSAPSNYGSSLASIITPIFSILFTVAMLLVILIVLGCFVVMLIVRYVYLVILLILMPLAWLFWIFPNTSSLFKQWWDKFIKWTFYAPIVVFFLWLAIATAQAMSNANAQGNANDPAAGLSALGYQTQTQVPVLSGLASIVGSGANTLIGTFAQMIVVVGLAIGGMVAAEKAGLYGAKLATGAVTSIKNSTVNWGTKQGKKAIARAVPQNVKKKLQTGDYGILPTRVQSWAGRGLENLERAGSSDLVDKEADWAKKVAKDPKYAARLLESGRGVNRDQTLALLKQMMAQDDLDEVKTVRGKGLAEFLNDNTFFDRDNQQKLFNDLNKRVGSTPKAREAGKAVSDEMENIPGAQLKSTEEGILALDKQMEEVRKLDEQVGKVAAFNPTADFVDHNGVVLAKGQAMKPGDLQTRIIAKFNDLDNQKAALQKYIDGIKNQAEAKATVLDKDGNRVNAAALRDQEIADLVKNQKKDDLKKATVNSIFGTGDRLGMDKRQADMMGESFARAVARAGSGGVFLQKLKAEPLEKFTDIYKRQLKQWDVEAAGNTALREKIEKLRQAFERATAFNQSYVAGGEEAGPAAAPSAPASAPSGGGKT